MQSISTEIPEELINPIAKQEFDSILDAHSFGYALARWGTNPQEWVYFHMVYTCPKKWSESYKILVNKIELQAERIETIIGSQIAPPRHNEHLEAISKVDR